MSCSCARFKGSSAHDRHARGGASLEGSEQARSRDDCGTQGRGRKEGRRLAKAQAQADPEDLRVIGFGSAYEAGRPRHSSDFDIGVLGLVPEVF